MTIFVSFHFYQMNLFKTLLLYVILHGEFEKSNHDHRKWLFLLTLTQKGSLTLQEGSLTLQYIHLYSFQCALLSLIYEKVVK